VKLRDGQFDGLQNRDTSNGVRVDIDLVGKVSPPPLDNPFDLTGALDFEPVAGGYTVTATGGALDADVGPALDYTGPPNLDLPVDDDTVEVALPFAFTFEGQAYTSVWVNSDGNLTFGSGDPLSTDRDVNRLLSGQPRIAPALSDLGVGINGGEVHAQLHADRAVFTWVAVPSWEMNLGDSNTFQAVLSADGSIRFVYGAMGLRTAVVGVAPGNDGGPAVETDLDVAAGDVQAPALFENFAVVGIGPASGNRVNLVLVDAHSSLAPTSYDPAPQPLHVSDNAPEEVTVSVTGGITY